MVGAKTSFFFLEWMRGGSRRTCLLSSLDSEGLYENHNTPYVPGTKKTSVRSCLSRTWIKNEP